MNKIKRPLSYLKPIPEENFDNNQVQEQEKSFNIQHEEKNRCLDSQKEKEEILVEIKHVETLTVSDPVAVVEHKKVEVIVPEKNQQSKWKKVLTFIFWLIILVFIFFLVFYSLKPSFVLNLPNEQPDLSKVLLASFIFSIIILAFVWLVSLCMKK